MKTNASATFGTDLEFLKQHTEIHVLRNAARGSRVVARKNLTRPAATS